MIVKNTSNKINFTLNCNGKLVYVQKPMVMGIINITPDSFFANSRTVQLEQIIAKVAKMVEDGVDIIDLGAQSTRPNSTLLAWDEEWIRLEQPLREIRKAFPTLLLSIDTFYSKIATQAIALGADMINDVSGGKIDATMIKTVGTLHVPYICMHMQGTPQTMQEKPFYTNVTKEVLDFFVTKKWECESASIKDIIFDIGFGFGKTIEHNFELLQQLDIYSPILEKPIMVGISRKSMIYKTLNITPEESLNGTTALHSIALLKGAAILRVHDVKEAVETVTLVGMMP